MGTVHLQDNVGVIILFYSHDIIELLSLEAREVCIQLTYPSPEIYYMLFCWYDVVQ